MSIKVAPDTPSKKSLLSRWAAHHGGKHKKSEEKQMPQSGIKRARADSVQERVFGLPPHSILSVFFFRRSNDAFSCQFSCLQATPRILHVRFPVNAHTPSLPPTHPSHRRWGGAPLIHCPTGAAARSRHHRFRRCGQVSVNVCI